MRIFKREVTRRKRVLPVSHSQEKFVQPRSEGKAEILESLRDLDVPVAQAIPSRVYKSKN